MSADLQFPSGRHILIWQYTVQPEMLADFLAVYNSEGDWAKLFAKADGFCGTSLLQSSGAIQEFVTIDVWKSSAAFDNFKRDFVDIYTELDKRCERLTEHEQFLGAFTS